MKIRCESWKEVIDTLKKTELTDDNIALVITPCMRTDKLTFEIETEN